MKFQDKEEVTSDEIGAAFALVSTAIVASLLSCTCLMSFNYWPLRQHFGLCSSVASTTCHAYSLSSEGSKRNLQYGWGAHNCMCVRVSHRAMHSPHAVTPSLQLEALDVSN